MIPYYNLKTLMERETDITKRLGNSVGRAKDTVPIVQSFKEEYTSTLKKNHTRLTLSVN